MQAEVGDVMAALAEPFEASEVKWKPGAITGGRALALAYVDARVVQDRLDDVLGVTGWQDDYEFLPDGQVVCRLRVRVGSEWLCKVDVGGESEQPDGGDRKKAAVSDALKRAAVKFGVGRYLYRLPAQWVDYDPQKKQMRPPALPEWARPGKKPAPSPAPSAGPAGPAEGSRPAASAAKKNPPPASGKELMDRLEKFEADLVKQKLCEDGEMLGELAEHARALGWPDAVDGWSAEHVKMAVTWAVAYKTHLLAKKQGDQRDGVR